MHRLMIHVGKKRFVRISLFENHLCVRPDPACLLQRFGDGEVAMVKWRW